MGQSDQEKAFEQLFADVGRYNKDLKGQSFSTANLFRNYKSPYDAKRQMRSLGDFYGKKGNIASKMFGRNASRAGSETAGRMAGQGITSGSVANLAVERAKGDVMSDKYDYLEGLDVAEAGGRTGIMDKANTMDFNIVGARQGVDSRNTKNKMDKWNMMLQGLMGEGQVAGNLDDSSWLDDVLAVVNTGANVAGAFI